MSDRLQPVSPESAGVPSTAVLNWLMRLNSFESPNAFQLMRHGRVIARGAWRPYTLETPHLLYSLSKSFTSCAVGLAEEEGLLRLDDPVAKFFPDKLPENPDPRYLELTVRDLLTMADGHDRCALEYMIGAPDGDFVAAYFRSPLSFAPGERFVYNSGASYMLSALVCRAAGTGLVEYLRPRLLEPLGIKHFDWECDPHGIELGGWGYSLSVLEISAFAEMLRCRGMWRGRRIMPEAYLKAATSFQIDNSMNEHIDWKQGYGYQFWRTRDGNYRGDGALGQYALILEKAGATLAVTSGLVEMGRILDATFELLLPYFSDVTLPENPEEFAELSKYISTLSIPLAAGDVTSPMIPALNGAKYAFADNPAGLRNAAFGFGHDRVRVDLEFADHAETVEAGYGFNIDNLHRFERLQPRRAAASAAWPAPEKLTVKLVEYETPFQETYTFVFDGDGLSLQRWAPIVFMTVELPEMTATRC